MRTPDGMSEAAWTKIGRLPSDIRDRVLERSCLLFYGGAAATFAEADERALAAEGLLTQRTLGGVE